LVCLTPRTDPADPRTLGVVDLPRAVDFYERVLGWKSESSPPGVVFFDLNGDETEVEP
jgi:predicted enzyme related to lactoylglutathione lyase